MYEDVNQPNRAIQAYVDQILTGGSSIKPNFDIFAEFTVTDDGRRCLQVCFDEREVRVEQIEAFFRACDISMDRGVPFVLKLSATNRFVNVLLFPLLVVLTPILTSRKINKRM